MAARRKGTVERAVEAELRALRKVAPDLAAGALAASAKVLARELDDPGNSATSKSMCQGRLRETLDRLRELAPEPEQKDGVDALLARVSDDRGSAA